MRFLLIIFFVLSMQIIALACNCGTPSSKDNIPQEDANIKLPRLFNITHIKEKTHNYDYFRIYLKEIPPKGIGVFARQKIPANRLVMYYKLKVFNRQTYRALSFNKYSFTVHAKRGNRLFAVRDQIADIYKRTNQKPKARKPFWGYLANEPSRNQTENVIVRRNNWDVKEFYKEGDIIIYGLYSSRDIEPDEEITWCYGDSYVRNYHPNC